MRKRGLCCRPVSVRLSVSLSRSYIVSRRLEIIKPLSPPRRPIILVFLIPSAGTQFQFLQRAAKYTGWETFPIFEWNRRLSRKQFEIGPWLLWNVNMKSKVADWSVSLPTTFSDLERPDARNQIVRDLLNNAVTVWRRTTKLGRITRVR